MANDRTQEAAAPSLLRDERGAAALLVALVLPVIVGAAAFAVDIGHYRLIDTRLQSAADAAALAAVRALDEPGRPLADALAYAAANVPGNFGTVTTAADVEIGIYTHATRSFVPGGGADANAVRVVARRDPERGNAPPRTLSLLLGDGAISISATAIAARQLSQQYEAPEAVNLSPDAGDFNEMYAYCFDYESAGTAEERRSQMTLVANNTGNLDIVRVSGGVIGARPASSEQLAWPRCGPGESLSFRMRNIRHAKNFSQLWADPEAEVCVGNCGTASPNMRQIGRNEHNHFTDTVITGGVERFHLQHNILETFRCDSQNCADELRNGTIPNNVRNRDPNVESRPCMPGKWMYFGWEDRPPAPPGTPANLRRNWYDPFWTDRDYDDIRIVMRCPASGMLGDGMVRLVR